MPERKEVNDMRKATFIIGIVAGIAMAFLAGLGTSTQMVSADAGPHIDTGSDATPDKCASCHRIHTGAEANRERLLQDGPERRIGWHSQGCQSDRRSARTAQRGSAAPW
jgi:hypothetical protein